MQTKFMISYKDRKLGPLTESQIRKMLAGRQIQPTDYYFDDEKQDWVPLLERFIDGVATAAAPSPSTGPVANAALAKGKSAPPPPHRKQSLDEFPKSPKPEMLMPEGNDFEVLELNQETPPPVAKAPAPAPVPVPAVASMPKPGPKPTSKPAAVAAEEPANKVRLDGGVGTLSLTQVKAGPVSLHLKSNSGMELPVEIKVNIQAAPASQMKMEAPQECRAGEEITVKLSAWDSYENLAVDFNGSFEVLMSGKKKESRAANFERGWASVTFKPTCAEILSFQVNESKQHKLTLPEPVEVKIHPNVPVKLVAEAPEEVRAGENIDLKITALDAYGNVVNDFKGEIDLKVEATPVKKVS